MDAALRTARFHHPATDGRPWWSDELYDILGMTPGDVPPTLDALLRHVRADERQTLEAAVGGCVAQGRPFAQIHTIKELRGVTREVTIAGVALPTAQDGAHDVDGVVVDVSRDVAERAAARANAELATLLAGRSVVEQSVGVLGLVYGVDRATALELLRWTARQRQLELVPAAEAVVAAAQQIGGDLGTDQAYFERAVAAAVERTPPQPKA